MSPADAHRRRGRPPVARRPFRDRSCVPFGNEWYIATHVEDVSEEEMKRRMARETAA